MRKKRNPLLLASAVFGAVVLVYFIIIWMYVIKLLANTEGGFSFNTFLENISNPQDKYIRFALGAFILLMVIVASSFIFNLIGWNKGSNRHVLIAGILYALCLNLVSAPLCLTEYYGAKHSIKNKLLFYAMVYALVFSVFIIIPMIIGVSRFYDGPKEDFKDILLGWIFMISIASVGLFLNYKAWKINSKKTKIIAGILYVFGIANVLSAILCFISCKDNRKLPEAEEKATSGVAV
jgi:hypothetical protein